jgi:hypothetical protein
MRLSPAPVSVKTAATEQKDKNNDDQQEFHNFLQNLRFGLFRVMVVGVMFSGHIWRLSWNILGSS